MEKNNNNTIDKPFKSIRKPLGYRPELLIVPRHVNRQVQINVYCKNGDVACDRVLGQRIKRIIENEVVIV